MLKPSYRLKNHSKFVYIDHILYSTKGIPLVELPNNFKKFKKGVNL